MEHTSAPSKASGSTPGAPSSWFEDEQALLSELKRSGMSAPLDAPPTIPGYDQLRELSRGGQGVVYEGVQRGTKRRVAIKVLLDSAYYSQAGRGRFQREVDLVSSLRHPGIVRVYDSGLTEQGRAYLVMEFVEGQPLQDYVQAKGGDARTALEVVARVCDAVQHAHMRGVIHRDLKPSNVRIDAEGTPRVLDFGLAKAEGVGKASDGGTLTTTGQFLGSLPWASPEQAQGAHDGVDTRSDVYSLGVMLYQLLCGKFPYDVSGSLPTALHNIMHLSPRPIRQVRPAIDEQVWTILAKALEKEPARRYQSAGDLADDIRFHLAGEPIRARRESTWRTLQRKVQRYRVVGVMGAVALALVASAGGVAIVQARRATQEKEASQRATTQAQSAASFLREVLSSADPKQGGMGISTRVVDVLDKAGAGMDARFADSPETLSDMHAMMGEVYTGTDQLDKADAHLARALEVEEMYSKAPDRASRLATLRGSIASLRLSQGRYEDAIKGLERAADEHRALDGEKSVPLMLSYSDLGMTHRIMGTLDKSQEAFDHAFAAAPEGAKSSDGYITLLNNYANLKNDQGDTDAAEKLFKECLALRAKVSGEDASETLIVRGNLGYFYIQTGNDQACVDLMEPKVGAARVALGDDHQSYLMYLNNLATAHDHLKHKDVALAYYEQIIASYRKRPEKTRAMIAPLGNLGSVYADLGRNEDALAASKECYELTIHFWGDSARESLIPMNNYAVSLVRLGKYDEALTIIRRVCDLSGPAGGIYPAGHWQHDAFRSSLGNVLMKLGHFDEAERTLKSAFDNLKSKLGDKNYLTTRTASRLVELYTTLKRPDEAATYRPFTDQAAK